MRTSCENVGTVQFLSGAHKFPRLSQGARKNTRERSPMLKGLLRIRRYQQETPCALQEVENRSWLRFGEAYSALRDWRPIPAALLSHSVVQCSGTEDKSFQLRPPIAVAPLGRQRIPTNQRSIRKKTCSVKLSSKQVGGKLEFWPIAYRDRRFGDDRVSWVLKGWDRSPTEVASAPRVYDRILGQLVPSRRI